MRSLSLLFSLVLCAGQLFGGVYYESTMSSQDPGQRGDVVYRTKAWVDGDSARVLFEGSNNTMLGEGNYIITRDGGASVFLVNPTDKSYCAFSLDQVFGMLNSMSAATGGMVKISFSDGYAKQLASAPAEPILGHQTTKVTWKSGFVMTTKVMGMKHNTKMDTTTEAWIAPDLKDAGFGIWLRKEAPKTGNAELDKSLEAAWGSVDGFPLKTVSTTTTTDKKGRQKHSTSTMEVTVLRKEATPENLFIIPSGFRQISWMEMAGGQAAGTGQGGEEGEQENPLKHGLKGLFGG